MKAQFEKIIPGEANSFKAFAYEKDEFDAPWHYHPEFELTYILKSRGIRYTGTVFENFEENDLVLLGPNLPHCWKNTAEQRSKAAAIVIHWDHNLLGKGWLEQNEFSNVRKLFQLASKGIKFEPDFALTLRSRLLQFLELSSLPKLIGLLEILNELALSDAYRILCAHDFNYKLKHEDHERVNTIYQFVKNRYPEKITLKSISDKVHMSEESFSRFFSRLMNKPFFTFLNEFRINVSCSLLIETDLPVTEVAYRCGFESLPFFFRQFNKYKGSTPHQYRKAFQGIAS